MQDLADSGTLKKQVYPTQVRDQMSHPVLSPHKVALQRIAPRVWNAPVKCHRIRYHCDMEGAAWVMVVLDLCLESQSPWRVGGSTYTV